MSDKDNKKMSNTVSQWISTIIAICILIGVVLYMSTFQLAYHQCAVLTTFGKATKGYSNIDGSEAGLKWKWPWPVQKVYYFDARIKTLSDRLEQQETKDRHVVILNMYMTWRICDPLSFYRTFTKTENSQQYLRDRLSSARWIIGEFTFEDLTNVDPDKLKIADAEQAILKQIQNDIKEFPFGIEISNVGIKRILLPKSITQAVFGRMRVTRQRLAQNARSEGEAIARSIRAQAHSDQKRILSFAERMAQEIRSEGDEAAAKYYHIFKENEEFAIFIRKLESLKHILDENTIYVLDTETPPFDLFKQGLLFNKNE